MRKSYLFLLSFMCGALIVSASLPAAAYVYRYHPGNAAVDVNPSVLDDSSQQDRGWFSMPEGYQTEQEAPQQENAQSNEPPTLPAAKKLPTEVMPMPMEAETPANTVAPNHVRVAPKHVTATPQPVPVTSPVEVKPLSATPATDVEDKSEGDKSPLATLTPDETGLSPPKEAAPEVATKKADAASTETTPTIAVPSLSDLSLNFDAASSTLSPQAQEKLDALVSQIKDAGMRMQIRGFAKGDDSDQSSARRMSLARALAVRSYLMDKGIKPVRLDVRALGSETDQMPIDRVDLVFVR